MILSENVARAAFLDSKSGDILYLDFDVVFGIGILNRCPVLGNGLDNGFLEILVGVRN